MASMPTPGSSPPNSVPRRFVSGSLNFAGIGSSRISVPWSVHLTRTPPTVSRPSSPKSHFDDEQNPCFGSCYCYFERERQFEMDIRRVKGLEVRRMMADGNCLFRAVADQVYGDSDLFDLVRQMCIDYMEDERDYFSQFISEDFASYCNRKSRDKVYGNDVEIEAMSEMYNRPIHIYSYGTEPVHIFHGNCNTDAPPMRLSYHHGNHYNSLVSITGISHLFQDRDQKFEMDIRRVKGLEIKKMAADGNCLFGAVADQVYGDPDLYDLVRQRCIDYMEQERDHFSQFTSEGFTSYCKRKRRDKVHGNDVEIEAMSELYDRPIHIYSYGTEPISIFHGNCNIDAPPIRLSYHNENHYNSLVDPTGSEANVEGRKEHDQGLHDSAASGGMPFYQCDSLTCRWWRLAEYWVMIRIRWFVACWNWAVAAGRGKGSAVKC